MNQRQKATVAERANAPRARRFVTPFEAEALQGTVGFVPRADYRQAPGLMYVGEIGMLDGVIICVVQA